MAALRGVRKPPLNVSGAIFRPQRVVKEQKRFLCSSKQPSQLAFVSSEYNELYKRSIENPAKFWGDLASNRLEWLKPFTEVMDCDMKVGKHRWFMDGLLNVSGLICTVNWWNEFLCRQFLCFILLNVSHIENCLDRHVHKNPDSVALIWEKDEPGKHENVTYR